MAMQMSLWNHQMSPGLPIPTSQQTLCFMAGPIHSQLAAFHLLLHNYEFKKLMTDHFESFQNYNSKTLVKMPINFSTQTLLHTKQTPPIAPM
jgi:hypothetical protein